jgi:outer membrane protein assembly factor BamB
VWRRFLLILSLVASRELTAGDSPQFRGPGGEGHSSEKHLPLKWSESENIRWTSDVEGLGWSTPSISGSQVWLTTSLENGKSLRVICLDEITGTVVHNVEVFHHDEPGPIHGKNSYASPSVLIETDRVYAHFGKLGTSASWGRFVWIATRKRSGKKSSFTITSMARAEARLLMEIC